MLFFYSSLQEEFIWFLGFQLVGDNQARERLQIPDLYLFFLQIKKKKERNEEGRTEAWDRYKASRGTKGEREKKAKNERGGMARERQIKCKQQAVPGPRASKQQLLWQRVTHDPVQRCKTFAWM